MKTTSDFIRLKKDGEAIVMLTAYDAPSAQLAEQAEIDCMLVGDSCMKIVIVSTEHFACTQESA